MRKMLLTTASIVSLTLAGSVVAQTQTPGQSPAMPGQSPGMQGQTGTTTAPSVSTSMQTYESYNEKDDFEGSIAGDHDADDLKDATVVNKDGDELGTIEDLAIGAGDRVDYVVVDVGEAVDEDERFITVDLDMLQRGEGDADDDEFVLDRSKDELRSMTQYEKSDNRWAPKSSN